MTAREPIDELKELWEKFVQKTRLFFKNTSHRDLKRGYGKECASIMLRELPHQELYFRLDNGVTLKGMADLAEHLPRMDEQTFQRHVNAEKNDFSAWVGNVIGDQRLATKLKELDNPADAARAVNVRVNWFKSRLE